MWWCVVCGAKQASILCRSRDVGIMIILIIIIIMITIIIIIIVIIVIIMIIMIKKKKERGRKKRRKTKKVTDLSRCKVACGRSNSTGTLSQDNHITPPRDSRLMLLILSTNVLHDFIFVYFSYYSLQLAPFYSVTHFSAQSLFLIFFYNIPHFRLPLTNLHSFSLSTSIKETLGGLYEHQGTT